MLTEPVNILIVNINRDTEVHAISQRPCAGKAGVRSSFRFFADSVALHLLTRRPEQRLNDTLVTLEAVFIFVELSVVSGAGRPFDS